MTGWWFLKVTCGLLLIADGCWVQMRTGPPSHAFLPIDASTGLAIGQFVVLVGGGLHLYHFGLLRSAIADIARPHVLITEGGLYPWIRHPMYTGDALVMVGFVLFARDPASLALMILGWIGLAGQARAEDESLARQFPERFARWEKTTWRLFPPIL